MVIIDCRSNGKLQEFFHPGLFVNSKWSCCDHRSKHSYGCTRSFVSLEAQSLSNPPTTSVSAFSRKPLPPTPLDNGGHNMGGAEMNNTKYPPVKHQYDQGTVSNEHIRRGNPHIQSYTHHSPGGMDPQPPLPVSHKLHPLYTPTLIIIIITGSETSSN